MVLSASDQWEAVICLNTARESTGSHFYRAMAVAMPTTEQGKVVISWSSALPVKVPIVSVYHGAVTCLPESKVSFPATEERGGYPKMGRIWRSGHCPLGGKDGCGPDGNNQPVVNHHIRSVRMILAQHPAVYPLYSMNNKQLGKVHVVLLLTVHRCFGLRPSVC